MNLTIKEAKYHEQHVGSGRQNFFEQITENANDIPQNIDLTTFMDMWTYKGEFTISPQLLVDGFLHLKQEQFQGQIGNVVNYFTTVAKGLIHEQYLQHYDVSIDCDSENAKNSYNEAIDNALSLVAEHPLAEVVKKEQRILVWTKSHSDLESQNGFSIGRVIQNACLSSQKGDFEKGRYDANKDNFEKLQKARQRGDYRTFVEFSPSPDITPEAVSRGYLGNSCIFFYDYDPKTQQETVTQRWLRAEWKDFEDLIFSDLEWEIEQDADDVDIMRASDFVNPDQQLDIASFIDYNNGKITNNHDELMNYVDCDLRIFLYNRLQNILVNGAKNLINGEPVHNEMENLLKILTYSQFRLRNEVAQLSGLNTVHAGSSLRVCSDAKIEQLDINSAAFVYFMQKNGKQLQLVGCGVNTSGSSSNISSGYGVFGGMTEAVFMGEDKYGVLEFECPDCHRMNIREKGKLVSACQHCGSDKVACEDAEKYNSNVEENVEV